MVDHPYGFFCDIKIGFVYFRQIPIHFLAYISMREEHERVLIFKNPDSCSKVLAFDF